MSEPECKSVLHVLPHPGGGGEAYVDSLSSMEGYRAERAFLAPSPNPSGAVRAVLRNAFEAQRAARAHDLLHLHGEVAATLCLPALAVWPSVLTLHGLNLVRRLEGARKTAAQANLRLLVRAAARTICVSESEHDDVVAAVGARVARRTVVIHNGVAVPRPPSVSEREAARAELGIPAGVVAGVWVGVLEEVKDPLTAVRAALLAGREGAPLTLLVAGDGSLRSAVELAAAEGETVRVLGFREDVARLLAAADFFVLSSRREGLAYSLLEAMALGLPSVVSDPPGNVEAVADAGIVVPRGDIGAFAAAFRRMASDEPHRLALGERARTRVEEHFRVDEMVRRTRELYDEVSRR